MTARRTHLPRSAVVFRLFAWPVVVPIGAWGVTEAARELTDGAATLPYLTTLTAFGGIVLIVEMAAWVVRIDRRLRAQGAEGGGRDG